MRGLLHRNCLILAAALLVGGCAAQPTCPHGPETAERHFRCADGFTFSVRQTGGTARIRGVGRQLCLERVPAASGAKYRTGDALFWSKGEEALLEVGGKRHRDCAPDRVAATFAAARKQGIDFRAVGQEPGWYLEIDADRQLELVADYGEQRLFLPAPAVEKRGELVVYRSTSPDLAVEAVLDKTTCLDTMNGMAFPFAVTVTFNGRTLHGCGQFLPQRQSEAQ